MESALPNAADTETLKANADNLNTSQIYRVVDLITYDVL